MLYKDELALTNCSYSASSNSIVTCFLTKCKLSKLSEKLYKYILRVQHTIFFIQQYDIKTTLYAYFYTKIAGYYNHINSDVI